MKKVTFAIFLFLVSLTLFSCKSKSEKEAEELKSYISAQGITTQPTASGLYYIEQTAGTGPQATKGSVVKVNYEGKFLNGSIFDSSYERNEPFEFSLGIGQVIKGWDEGIALMKQGGKAQLIIPSTLGYGSAQNGTIPAYSTLVFDVELLEVK